MMITMRSPSGFAFVLALVSGGLVAGCGGGSGPATRAGAGTTTTTTVTAPVGPRSFSYVNNDLVATLHVDGATGAVVFTNGRTTRVLTPVIYLLDATGVRVNAVLPGVRSIPPESRATFRVRFPSGTDTATAGFFGLEFGGKDAGGFTDR